MKNKIKIAMAAFTAMMMAALPAMAINYDSVWYNDNEHAACWLQEVRIYVSGTYDRYEIKGDMLTGGGYEYYYISPDLGAVNGRLNIHDTSEFEMWDVQVRAISDDDTHSDTYIKITNVDLVCN